MDEVYKELETTEGEWKHSKGTRQIEQRCQTGRQSKDEQGVVLWEYDKTMERWKGYYDKLLNEENPRTVFGSGVLNDRRLNSAGVELALKRRWDRAEFQLRSGRACENRG